LNSFLKKIPVVIKAKQQKKKKKYLFLYNDFGGVGFFLIIKKKTKNKKDANFRNQGIFSRKEWEDKDVQPYAR
jgi:hypothetical protein